MPCDSDTSQEFAKSICSLSDARALAILMMVVAALYIVVTLCCLFLWLSYSFFSNLPSEAITTDNSDWKVSCLGALAKQGPRMMRMANILAFVFMLVILLLTSAFRVCKGDLSLTHNCVQLYDDCAFNQIKNCHFYFSSNCAGTDMPFTDTTTSFTSQRTKCLSYELFSRFSGRFDARALHASSCSACWALHYDCLDTDISHMRAVSKTDTPEATDFTAQSQYKYAPYYGSSSGTTTQQAMLITIANKCTLSTVDTSNIGTTPTLQGTACLWSSNSAQSAFNSFATQDQANYHNGWLQYRTDAAFDLTAPANTCSWITDPASYELFEESECRQSGSYINRIAFLSAFVMLFCGGLVIAIGAIIRGFVPIETWCYNPVPADENVCYRVVRASGPG